MDFADDEKIHVFTFGCKSCGGPWVGLIEATRKDVISVLSGENLWGDNKKMICRAGVSVFGNQYGMIVYGSRAIKDPEKGEISISEFRKLLGKYRGSSSSRQDKYVARLGPSGNPISFQCGNDPFPTEFGLAP